MSGDLAPDRHLIERASRDLMTLARCLDVESALTRWSGGDTDSGGVAADGLDQARALLEELANGYARTLLDAVRRLAAALPPPLE
jgi:hypothetical protein